MVIEFNPLTLNFFAVWHAIDGQAIYAFHQVEGSLTPFNPDGSYLVHPPTIE